MRGSRHGRGRPRPLHKLPLISFTLELDELEEICFLLKPRVPSQACIIFLKSVFPTRLPPKELDIAIPEAAAKLKDRRDIFFKTIKQCQLWSKLLSPS